MARERTSYTIQGIDHFRIVEPFIPMGANVKDFLEDPDTGARYIAKLGRRNNDLEVMTEYAISIIGRSLGVSVANARIGRYKGQLRFLSEYFLSEHEELVHGVQLFKELHDEATLASVLGAGLSEQAMFTVQSIKAAFGAHYLDYGVRTEDELFGGFVSMLTHDALIGVMDRHHENWGVIIQRAVGGASPRFAPLYDSARGIFCNETDHELSRYSRSGELIDRYVLKSHPLVGFEQVKPAAGWHYIRHHELLEAVFRAYPEQRERIATILDAYDWKLVRDELREQLGTLCTRARLNLILVCLRRRLRLIHRALHGGSEQMSRYT